MRADLALAGDRANIHATHVAHARFVQGFVHGAAQVHGYIAALQFGGDCGIGWRGAHVDHRGHGHALLLQVEGGEVAVIVAGEDYRALARLDRVQLHQLRGAGQHDPGRSLLRNTTGWSNAPAATRQRLARTLYRRLCWITGR